EMIGSGVDLLFANEDEAKGVVGAADLDSAIDYLKTLSQEFVITRGSRGALVWDGRTLIGIDPVKVEAVDTVGAGDMFAGAFLYGRGRGWDHRRAGALASAASAKLVTSLGPRMSAAETQAVLHGFP
ncbi:MAG: adenosine kinase, partial [Candidatus Competibacteraceae bacterium]|nr:adenosine kinase [Candidatus Competibacteraceae bacterium]